MNFEDAEQELRIQADNLLTVCLEGMKDNGIKYNIERRVSYLRGALEAYKALRSLNEQS